MKKQLTIQDRVDRLLEHGVDNPKKWATVHGYVDPTEPIVAGDLRASDEWKRLREHHLEETNFLFDVIRELVKRLDSADEQLANAICVASSEDD